MKDLFTCFSNFWSNILGSESRQLGLISEEAAIEHPLSTHSAPIGRSWKPNGRMQLLVKCAAMLFFILTLGVGNAWGASITYTFSTKAWKADPADWTGSADGNGFTSGQGVQCTTTQNGVTATSPASFTAITKVVVTYNTNKSAGAGSMTIKIGTNSETDANNVGYTSGDGRSQNYTTTFNFSPAQTGTVRLKTNVTTNSIWPKSVTIYYQTDITLNANGGAANKSAKYNHEGTTYAAFTAVTRDGYNCTGYWTASSGGTKILNADGSLAGANITVSTVPYTSSSKWVYAGGTLTLYAQWEAAGCSNYSFHYQHSSDWNTDNICFTQVSTSVNYLTDELSLPYAEWYNVTGTGNGGHGASDAYTYGFTGTTSNTPMPFYHYRSKSFGANPQSGNIGGGLGRFHVYGDSDSKNKYVSFIPTYYTLNFGTGDTWTNDSTLVLSPESSDWDETDFYSPITTLSNAAIGRKIFVGLKTTSGYVWCSPYSVKENLSGLRTKSNSGNNWVDGGLTTSYASKRGKFRVYANSGDNNWYVTFIPHHRIIYHANYPVGDSPADTYSVDVSVEETKSDIALPSAPTAPTGYTFAGWYDAASGGTKKTGNQTISAGASADPEYYAHWYGITLVVKDEDGTTLSGDGKPTLTRSGLSLTATTAGKYVFKDIQITSGTGTLSSTSSTTPTITAISSDITVTATFYKPIAVTKGTNTGAATFTLSATEVARGDNVNITCAADASHKGNPTITATSGNYSTISVASATSASVNGITGPVTINISYTAKETATVKLHVAGSTSTISGTRYEGDSYTLPSEAAECPDMGLYGWYTTDYEHATTAPSGANFKLPGASATLAAGDNDFYAVYATVTPDAADTYTKITSTDDLVTGDYLIVGTPYTTMYAMKNAYQSSESTMADESRTVTDNKITNSASDKPEFIWHFTKSNSTITIYSANSSKYFGFSSNHVALMNSSQALTYEVSGGLWAIYSGSDYLKYASYFQRGDSKVYQTYLFKRDPSIAGPYTTDPSCTTHSLSTAVTPVSTGTAVAGKTVIGEGKTTTVTATPESGYAFRYWTISGEGSTMSNTSDGKSTDNPVTVTMGTADATITAHFAERVAITFNVPTGVTKPSNSYTDVALPTPSGFPTAVDDDCWAFAGWTESSSVNSTSAPATLYPAGSIYSGSQESAFNLYAVYSRNKYLVVYDNDMLEADADYVISTWDGDSYAVVGIADDNDAEVADMADYFHDKVLKGLHYYTLDNPTENAVWHLTGTSGSYVLQNKATGKYLDVAGSSLISGSSATLAITEGTGEDAQTYKVTGGDNHLVISSSGASVATGDAEYYFLYKMISSKYMTTPAEPTYAVTYKVSGQSDVVKNVNACTGITASDIPDAPDDDAIGDCADTFMGWSATDLGSADDQDAPDDLFTTYTNAPYLTGDLTLYAVFATAGSGGSTTHTLTKDNTSWSGYTTGTQDDDQGETWSYYAAGQNQSGTYYWSLNSNALNYNIGSPSFSGNVTSLKAYVYNASSKDTKTIYVCSSNETAQPTSGDLGSYVVPASENGEITITISGTFNQFYIYTSAALYIKYITVTYSSVSYSDYKTSCSCNGNPTVTSSASLKGTFSLSEVGVTVADLSVGTGCEWTDAGFVWSPSTNTTPTVGGTNCTKVQVLTSGTDATFDGTLEGEFEVDATYYYRAYGKNEYESGSYQYSTSVSSFIPRSVTFNSNGGSSVATKYVPNGTPVTAPDDPTKTGYDFSKWQLSGADYNFSSNVTASITLDAVWTAQSYSITYKDQGGGDYSGNKTAGRPTGLPGTHTYGSATDVSTDGSKSGYTFGGWYLEEDCSGDEVTSLGATSFDEDITLYAKWTAKKNYFVDRMHGNCDGVNTVNIGGIVYNCYLREGAGYTVPDLSDNDTGSNSCVSGHAHFIGWVVAGKIGAQGQLVSGYTVIKGETVQTAGTDGTIYYAVWAEE